jgi:hypothetical protein
MARTVRVYACRTTQEDTSSILSEDRRAALASQKAATGLLDPRKLPSLAVMAWNSINHRHSSATKAVQPELCL